MIRLVAIDLDGTLLDDKKLPPPGFDAVIEKLYAHGVLVVIASGRQYFNLWKIFPRQEDKLLFLCENGALAFDGKTNIFASEIPKEKLARPYLCAAGIASATPLLCGVNGAYMRPPSPIAERNAKLYYEKRIYSADPLAASAQDRIVKIAVFDEIDAATDCAVIPRDFQTDFSVALAGKNWIDLMNPGINKGVALRKLQAHLQISPSECMAFGDYMNDYEMLQSVEFSYAMENGLPEVKKIAHFIAPSNLEYGVLTVLKQKFPFL